MNNLEFVNRCKKIAESGKTLYVLGGWGQSASEYNKNRFINNYPFNRSTINRQKEDGTFEKSNRQQVIKDISANYRFYDCNCFVKATIDSDDNGSINYASPCPDVTIVQMLADCTDVSTDFSNIMIGELVTFKDKSHCGVYVGGGKVVECLFHWKDGVQYTDLGTTRWFYHGKMTKYIDYTVKETSSEEPKIDITKELDDVNKALAALTVAVDTLNSRVGKGNV